MILIVDDNSLYANNLKNHFDSKNILSKRAINAIEGFEMFQKEYFEMIITDITMETRISGLFLARKIYKSGYKGTIIISSTGFDFFGVQLLGKIFLPIFAGVKFMIPKVPLKKGEVVLVPTFLI